MWCASHFQWPSVLLRYLPIIFYKVEAFIGILVALHPLLLWVPPCGNKMISTPHFSNIILSETVSVNCPMVKSWWYRQCILTTYLFCHWLFVHQQNHQASKWWDMILIGQHWMRKVAKCHIIQNWGCLISPKMIWGHIQ